MKNVFEEVTVDTLPLEHADSAFVRGSVCMEHSPCDLPSSPMQWKDYPANYISVIVFTVIFTVYVRKYFKILPYLFRSMVSYKNHLKQEEKMKFVRERNSVVFVSMAFFCIIVSAYNLYSPSFMHAVPPDYKLPSLFVLAILFVILRRILMLILNPENREIYKSAGKIADNFLIVISLIFMITSGILSLLKIPETGISSVLLYELYAVFILFIIRRMQILSNLYNHFTAILYLCVLEIIPFGLIVLSVLL